MGRVLFLNSAIRFSGSVGSPIGFAAVLAACAAGLTFLEKKEPRDLALIGLLLLAIPLTGTRSVTVLGFVFVLVVALLRADLPWQGVALARRLAGFTAIWIAFVSLLTSVGHRLPDFLREAVRGRVEGSVLDTSASFKAFLLRTVAENITAHEVMFGLGLGGFPSWFAEKTGQSGVAPHFETLRILLEGGAIAAALYVGAVVIMLRRSHHNLGGGPRTTLVLLGAVTFDQTVLQFANPFYFYQLGFLFAALLGHASKTYCVFSHAQASRNPA